MSIKFSVAGVQGRRHGSPMRTWKDICGDRSLENLPYKIETNRLGQIVLSLLDIRQGGLKAEIGSFLQKSLIEGKCILNSAVETSDGVKVPDVSWVSNERLAPHRRAFTMPIAPEICVEVRSYSNSVVEMMGKMQLYFASGAEEVWFCDEDGNMTFYRHDVSEATTSKLCPDFPVKFEW